MAKREVVWRFVFDALDYDPDTGDLRWKKDGRRRKAGDIAGWLNSSGYRIIGIGKRRVLATDLIWFLVMGRFPMNQIDHRDGDPTNNRWDNLREATHAQNMMNRKLNANNKTGYKGVQQTESGRYEAKITADKKIHHLGTFDTAEQAADAYNDAAIRLHGEWQRK